MTLSFLTLLSDERRLYVEQAAARLNRSPVIVEKDFWVCWTLAALFDSRFGDAVVFKGGTSLSKVFGVIDRFSEDVDLSISPLLLGLQDTEPTSRAKGNTWMKNAEARCGEFVRDELAPALQAAAAGVPGGHASFEFLIDAASHSPVLLFHYPTTQPAGFDYLRRSVKLELGSLTDQRPTGRHPVRPWLAEVFPQPFEDWRCEVVALDLQRTFWEKATILHVEHHRPSDVPTPDRYSRHYADTAALARHTAVGHAVENDALRERVVNWKSRFFGSGWARYDLAVPGTFRLSPAPERVAALRRDYDAMSDMYPAEPIPFDQILATLDTLERRINRSR